MSKKKAVDPEEVAKLHCLEALFAEPGDEDAYFARQIKGAIEFSLSGGSQPVPLDKFAQAALRLFASRRRLPPSYGLYHLDLRGRVYEPLFVREELVAGLKKLAGYDDALIVITGLRESLQPGAKRWTPRLRRKHADTIRFIDALASRWTTRNSRLTLIYA